MKTKHVTRLPVTGGIPRQMCADVIRLARRMGIHWHHRVTPLGNDRYQLGEGEYAGIRVRLILNIYDDRVTPYILVVADYDTQHPTGLVFVDVEDIDLRLRPN